MSTHLAVCVSVLCEGYCYIVPVSLQMGSISLLRSSVDKGRRQREKQVSSLLAAGIVLMFWSHYGLSDWTLSRTIDRLWPCRVVSSTNAVCQWSSYQSWLRVWSPTERRVLNNSYPFMKHIYIYYNGNPNCFLVSLNKLLWLHQFHINVKTIFFGDINTLRSRNRLLKCVV